MKKLKNEKENSTQLVAANRGLVDDKRKLLAFFNDAITTNQRSCVTSRVRSSETKAGNESTVLDRGWVSKVTGYPCHCSPFSSSDSAFRPIVSPLVWLSSPLK